MDAQENPLSTIDAKKFYEVQKFIMLTGHIVDGLITRIAPQVWNRLSDAEKKSFVDAVLKNSTPESLGYDRKDHDRIVALK